MESGYIINKWAVVRRNELVDIPETIQINPCFTEKSSGHSIENAFRRIWELFYNIMTEISVNPEKYAMPLYKENEYSYGAREAQESRYAPWRPSDLLYSLFKNGEYKNGEVNVDLELFKNEKKVKGSDSILKALEGYGFYFKGLVNYRITSKTKSLSIGYPSNPNIPEVLALMAKKAANSGCPGAFKEWNYRLLEEDMYTYGYLTPYYGLYDKMHDDKNREFIYEFHKRIEKMGFYIGVGGSNEGPAIRYYDKKLTMENKGAYKYSLASDKGRLLVMLRMRNGEGCAVYAGEKGSGKIKDAFRQSDTGCKNKPVCNKGVSYFFEGMEKWKCGCCGPTLSLEADINDIEHYFNLMELGYKK